MLSKLVAPVIKITVLFSKNILLALGLTTTASAADAAAQRKIQELGVTLVISNGKMEYIMKIVKVLKDCGLLIKGITKTIENKTKKQRGGFLGMLLSTLLALHS